MQLFLDGVLLPELFAPFYKVMVDFQIPRF